MIQVINRALDILEYLAKNKDSSHNLKDISAQLNLNAGTCANIIKTLISRNYIHKDEQRNYHLGLKAYQLTGSNVYRHNLVNASLPKLQRLTDKWNENTLLAAIEGDMRIILAKCDGKNNIKADSEDSKKVYQTAVGRLLLSNFANQDLHNFVDKFGVPSIDDWPEVKGDYSLLKEKLARIAADGFAIISNNEGITGFAVPLMVRNVAVAAIALYLPTFRLKKSLERDIIADLKTEAEKIEVSLA